MTIAQQLLDYLSQRGVKPGQDGYTMAALAWLSVHDPKGTGTLIKAADYIAFTFSDGSKLNFDLDTGTLSEPGRPH